MRVRSHLHSMILLTAVFTACLPALPDTLRGLTFAGNTLYPLGLELASLAELAKSGPALKAAGVNCVVVSGPTGATIIPWLWEAEKLGMKVLLKGEALRGSGPENGDERDRILRQYDCSAWTHGQPGFLGFLFPPPGDAGLTPTQYAGEMLVAKAGNPEALCVASRRLRELKTERAVVPGADLLAVIISPEDLLSVSPLDLSERLLEARKATNPNTQHETDILAAFLGQGPRAEELTETALQQAALAALRGRVAGMLFMSPANERVRQMQLGAIQKLVPEVAGVAVSRTAPPSREQTLASEASSPLLWRLQRFGEVTTVGLEPYVTPDGTTGYNVSGRALLNLAIPNRSGWVYAKRLTRFAMRMFSSHEGQGALLAQSTAGEVSYVRVPVQGGWHLYEIDLTQATWESSKVEGLKWGGSTGIVQGLSFTPPPLEGAQIAFDWIRLEPDSAGEVRWELDKREEVAKIEGLEGAAIAGGELRGKATGETVSLELALAGGRLQVGSLPFLSFKASVATTGLARVEYWWPQEEREEYGGLATFRLREDLPAQCVDLTRLGFAGATAADEEQWGGPPRTISRLRLILPVEKDKDFSLDWVRLGPNYDLRAVPSELVPEPPEEQ